MNSDGTRFRSSLTLLGVIIGVAAVVIMVNLVGGVTVQVRDQVANLGNNLIVVTPGKRLGPGQSLSAAPFKEEDSEAISRDIGAVAAVAPAGLQSLRVIFGSANWSTIVMGTRKEFFQVTRRSIKSGRNFNDGELRAGAAVCVIGETVRKRLFGTRNPVDSRIRIGKITFEVIGLLEPKGQSLTGADQDDGVYVPLRAFKRRISGNQDIDVILVSGSGKERQPREPNEKLSD